MEVLGVESATEVVAALVVGASMLVLARRLLSMTDSVCRNCELRVR